MKKKLLAWLLTAMLLMTSFAAIAEEETETASIVSANYLTQTLEWGETLTGIRIEYDDEIYSGDLQISQFATYQLTIDMEIQSLYCNNSGKLDDAELYGKYVFLMFAIPDDFTNYSDYIVFNENSKYRDKISSSYLLQQHDLTTKSGKVAPATYVTLKTEIRYDIDKFTTYDHPYTVDGVEYAGQYHVYVPEDYTGEEALPLIIHFGHDTYTDYSGNLYGTLIANNTATVWVSDDFQSRHKAIVVTFGATSKPPMSVYKEVLDILLSEYNIDTTRIYGVGYAGSRKNLWGFIQEYPNVLAAALIASPPGNVASDYGDIEEACAVYEDVIAAVPMWTFNALNDISSGASVMAQIAQNAIDDGAVICVSEDDSMWNGYLRGDAAAALAEAQIAEAEALGTDDLVTFYIPGTIRYTDHWSWVAVFNNPGVQEWLFSHVNDDPYTAE